MFMVYSYSLKTETTHILNKWINEHGISIQWNSTQQYKRTNY